MSAATKNRLEALHALIADTLIAALQARQDDQGQPIPVDPRHISAAIKFLKDNGIDTAAPSGPMEKLTDLVVPFRDDPEIAAESDYPT